MIAMAKKAPNFTSIRKPGDPIDIRSLKEFATNLQPKSLLRRLILSQNDLMEPHDFLSKVETWLMVADEERPQ